MARQIIPLVAISDTHLGEPTSLLCFESLLELASQDAEHRLRLAESRFARWTDRLRAWRSSAR